MITDSIKYVGVDDRKIDLFEGQYKVPEGISYNSYVITDEKIAVMDTVSADFKDEWLGKRLLDVAVWAFEIGPVFDDVALEAVHGCPVEAHFSGELFLRRVRGGQVFHNFCHDILGKRLGRSVGELRQESQTKESKRTKKHNHLVSVGVEGVEEREAERS